MKITIESTAKSIELKGVACRVWEGETESGVKILCLIPQIAVRIGEDVRRFEAEWTPEPTALADFESASVFA
jgi:hypothetical protein